MDDTRRDEEFAEFTAARWRHLVRTAVLLGCAPHEAEDLAQATLLKVYVHWAKVQRAEHRDAYVTRMLVNGFRSSRRRRWWRERPTEQVPETALTIEDDAADRVAGADAVEQALGHLSPDHREVVVLRYWSHLGERQIAEALGVAPGTVKSRLSRALARLAADPHLSDFDLSPRSPR